MLPRLFIFCLHAVSKGTNRHVHAFSVCRFGSCFIWPSLSSAYILWVYVYLMMHTSELAWFYTHQLPVRVPLHWTTKEFALCSYDMSHTVSGPVDFSQPFPTIFILYLGFGFPIGVWPCGRLVHSFGQRCTMPLDHMIYAVGCARHGHPSVEVAHFSVTWVPGSDMGGHNIDHSTRATCSREPSKTIRNKPTKAQSLWPYILCPSGTLLASMSISQALLALYLHQRAYLKRLPIWHLTSFRPVKPILILWHLWHLALLFRQSDFSLDHQAPIDVLPSVHQFWPRPTICSNVFDPLLP